MFGERRATAPNFAYYPAPNPNPRLIYYDPPGASPYSYRRDFDSVQPPPAFDPDPTAASRIEFMTQTTDSATYAHPGGTLNETTTAARTSHSYGRFNVVTEHVTNDVTLTTLQSENVQMIKCEICDIPCNSEDVLKIHKQGKKHLNNLQKLAISSAIGPPSAIASETLTGGLETKKHKLLQNGASARSLIFCDVCNVVCHSQDIFMKHLAGKKHVNKATKLANPNGLPNRMSGTTPPVDPSKVNNVQSVWCELCKVDCNSYEVLNIHLSGKKHLKKLKMSEKTTGPSSTPENPKSTQNSEDMSAWCELCGIGCNTDDMLKIHLSGKKHQKKLEKSKPNPAPTAEPPTTPGTIGSPQGSAKEEGKSVNLGRRNRSAASQEDLETKKQKIVEGGAAPDLLRMCDVCNVVCNSPGVFESHLAGQKHAAMVGKQADEAQSDGEQA